MQLGEQLGELPDGIVVEMLVVGAADCRGPVSAASASVADLPSGQIAAAAAAEELTVPQRGHSTMASRLISSYSSAHNIYYRFSNINLLAYIFCNLNIDDIFRKTSNMNMCALSY